MRLRKRGEVPSYMKPTKVNAKTIHHSLVEGTFTKVGTDISPVYGINRAQRRAMARTLKTKWVPFNWMLIKDPETVLKAYADIIGVPKQRKNFGGVRYQQA